MEKSLLEQLRAAKHENDEALVCLFNTGKVRKDKNYSVKRLKNLNFKDDYDAISKVFADATDSYSRHCSFDTMDMHLELGLIYPVEDVNEDNTLKEGARPVKDVVRYYIGEINSFEGGKQTNDIDYGRYAPTRQGFINFNELVKKLKTSGVEYTGPETFREFKDGILSGVPFDISMRARLVEEKEETFSSTKQK